jgi:glutamate-1-semialdehyde 2,1-aminomutase
VDPARVAALKQREDDAFVAMRPRGRSLWESGRQVMPNGVPMSWMRTSYDHPPLFVESAAGSRLRDVDGHEYVDYLLGLGPMILGHRHPVVTRAVMTAVGELGTCFGLPYELEIEAARKVTEAVPGVDLVRFSNSGSEVVGTAVRLARAHTGRRLIIRFEGHYHGWQDTVYWSNHVDPALAGPASRPRPVPSGPGVPAEL